MLATPSLFSHAPLYVEVAVVILKQFMYSDSKRFRLVAFQHRVGVLCGPISDISDCWMLLGYRTNLLSYFVKIYFLILRVVPGTVPWNDVAQW